MEEEGEKVLLTSVEKAEETKKEDLDNENAEKNDSVDESLIQIEKNTKDEKKGKFFSIFERKKSNSNDNEEPKVSQTESFSFKKLFSSNVQTKSVDNVDDEKQNGIEPPSLEQSQKRQLPKISSFLDKFRKGKYEVAENIELGNEPKAGLASMETLDDSTKDPWSTENGDKVDSSNNKNEESKEGNAQNEQAAEKPINLWHEIQNYECSLDDIALIAGIIIFIFLVGLIVIFTIAASVKQPLSPPVIDGKIQAITSCGPVEGLLENSAYAFRGIPYAKPPINSLRFASAQPLDTIDDCWNGTLEAHKPKPPCSQYDSKSKNISGIENCLSLDIITPEVRYINLLPVIVMLGADDFVNGSPNILRPSTRYARSESVIFVRPNFRMNVFGYLALESISNSSSIPSSGNYALSDIIIALEWIHLNIHNFGGDKNSVTLFGYRTGATLATALTASPKANKLFSKVWASSGSFHFPGKKLEDSERENIEYAKQFPNCSDLDDWQKIDSFELINKMPESWTTKHSNSLPESEEDPTNYHDWIVLDGIILDKHPEDYWKSSSSPKPKIVIGTTAHASFDSSLFKENMTETEIIQYVEDSKIGSLNLTEKAFSIYGKTRIGLVSMISDIRIVCPLLVQARSQSTTFYVVTQPVGNENMATIDADILAILGRLTTDTSEKIRYFNAMKRFFFHYIYHGTSNKNILEIQQDVLPKSNYENCDFWISHNIVPHYAAYF